MASTLAQACAGGPQSAGPVPAAGALEPGTVWNFSATARAANLDHGQRREFSEPVMGELAILTPDSASVVSTHGTCLAERGRGVRIVRSGAINRISCGDLLLEIDASSSPPTGTVSVMVDIEQAVRGTCTSWQVDSKTGARQACLAYDEQVRILKTRTTAAPLDLRISRAPDSPG